MIHQASKALRPTKTKEVEMPKISGYITFVGKSAKKGARKISKKRRTKRSKKR